MSELVAARQRTDEDTAPRVAEAQIPSSMQALDVASRQAPKGYRRAMYYI